MFEALEAEPAAPAPASAAAPASATLIAPAAPTPAALDAQRALTMARLGVAAGFQRPTRRNFERSASVCGDFSAEGVPVSGLRYQPPLGGGGGAQEPPAAAAALAAATGTKDAEAGPATPAEGSVASAESEAPPLNLPCSVFWMFVVAALIAYYSESLVSSIESFAKESAISNAFISTIMLPIAGNAAEHASAIIFAYKNRLDISLGVCVGSSIQIAMFVTPFCVLVSWCIGKDLSLNFYLFETSVVFITVILAAVVNMEGRVNWLQGLLLIMAYFVVGAAFLVHDGFIPPP